MSIDLKRLGKAIRTLREKKGFSQAELAKRAGLSQPAIAWIEQGRRSTSLEALNSIGGALDVPAACLTILGSAPIPKNRDATEFLAQLQNLILTTVEARERSRSAPPVKRRRRRTALVT